MEIKLLKDIQDGDYVFSSKGEWVPVKKTPVKKVEQFYLISLQDEKGKACGSIRADKYHTFPIYSPNKEILYVNSEGLYYLQNESGFLILGEDNKKYMFDVDIVKEEAVVCCLNIQNEEELIDTVSGDDFHNFLILTDEGEPVYTHNCGERIACGRLQAMGSRMCFDDPIGQTIPSITGRGLVKSQGEYSPTQMYWAEKGKEWVTKYYKRYGLDELGFDKDISSDTLSNSCSNENDISFDDVVEIDTEIKKTEYEFGGVKTSINKNETQKDTKFYGDE